MKQSQPTFDRTVITAGPFGATPRGRGIPRRSSTRPLAMTLAVAAVAIPLAIGLSTANDQDGHVLVPPLSQDQPTRDELIRDAVNRGLIPRQALDNVTVR